MNITQSPAVGLFNAIACIALLALVAWSELHPTHPEFHALPEIRQNEKPAIAWEDLMLRERATICKKLKKHDSYGLGDCRMQYDLKRNASIKREHADYGTKAWTMLSVFGG